MAGKRQIYISDTNHGTVLLSSYEKEVISTKLFNRLHHISQNSTAYLTFPTNRTKRFEHSIGTMKLCGDIFYSAICNTPDKIKSLLLKQLKEIIVVDIIQNKIEADPDKYRRMLGDKNLINKGKILKDLSKNKINEPFYNRCIPNNISDQDKLVYLIAFQSVRLCGLLHDIGHPPFSHITEAVINEIYKDLKARNIDSLTNREKQFYETIKDYDSGGNGFQLHEKMGIIMVNKLFSQILFSNNVDVTDNFEENRFKIIVSELTKLIISGNEKVSYIHDIISGTIDGDRLDYVNRDIENSGVDNGKIEYSRLIDSCRYQNVKREDIEKLEIVYDSKTISTIEDFFVKRLFLYKNVIFHHRVIKTDSILENCIKNIVLDYIESTEDCKDIENNILPDDISGLWLAIKLANSNTEYFDSLIQWDDNWLITILKRYYFKVFYDNDEDPTSLMLEEFLSNKKNYYSIVKTNHDFSFFNLAFEEKINLDYMKKSEAFLNIYNKIPRECKYRNLISVIAYSDFSWDKKLNIKEFLDDYIKDNYSDDIRDCFVISKQLKEGLDVEPFVYYNNGELNDEITNINELSNIRTILNIDRYNYPCFNIYVNFKRDIKNESYRKQFLEGFGKFFATKINDKIGKEVF